MLLLYCVEKEFIEKEVFLVLFTKKIDMKNIATNQSNKRFFKVQEELKRLLSIFNADSENSKDTLEDFETNGSAEEQKISRELLKSLNNIDYEKTVNQTVHSKQAIKKQIHSESKTTATRVNPTISKNTKSNIYLSKSIDDSEREI